MAKPTQAPRFSTKAALEQEPATHHVWDMNQSGPEPRVHRIHGRNWSLWNPSAPGHEDEGTKMPLSHALAFLKDEAFIVMDDDGNELKTEAPQGDEYRTIKLPPNMVVANLAELTVDALFMRAAQLPNGNMIGRADGKERIIEFIMAAGIPDDVHKVGPGERNVPDDDADLLVNDADGDAADADNIFAQTGAVPARPTP